MVKFANESHLVLTRKPGETIEVNGPAIFEIIEDRNGRTRISIRADRETHILRGELVGKPKKQG